MDGKAWGYTKPAAATAVTASDDKPAPTASAAAAAASSAEIVPAPAAADTLTNDQSISPAVVPLTPRVPVAEERTAALSDSDDDDDSENEMAGDFLDDLRDSSDSE